MGGSARVVRCVGPMFRPPWFRTSSEAGVIDVIDVIDRHSPQIR
jgi:hypothetical protein